MTAWRKPFGLVEFVIESNKIEGIVGATQADIDAHEDLLALRTLTVAALSRFVEEVAKAPLRSQLGMNVRVGFDVPPAGGPGVVSALEELLKKMVWGFAPTGFHGMTPYEAHVAYELLHPFMDGNGRSGRALWAWMMLRTCQDPFELGFLHTFYYQALSAARLRQ